MTAPRILVVEDERIIALHLRQQLTKLGYDVPNTVSTGDHALRRIEESQPDLVLMDINLKGKLDGIATAAAIRQSYLIPIIYLTAYSADEMLARAAATNPHGYLLKPFSERELHAMIQVTLARCRAERASLAAQERLLQTRKMEALSQLAGGIADQVDELLTTLYGQLETLGGHLIGEPVLADPIQDAFSEAIEKERLVRRLLEFCGRRKLTPVSIAVSDLMARVSGRLHQIVGDTIPIRVLLPNDLWPARIDPDQLAHALANLALNARAAMPDGGDLTIEAQNTVMDHHHLDGASGAGRYVLLSVTDTGTGMPEAVVERAFEPFFTTRPSGGGSGLGLSLVFGFIRQSGGHISIDSKPGNGTTVRIYLPTAIGNGMADTAPEADELRWAADVDPPGERATAAGLDAVLDAGIAVPHRPGDDRISRRLSITPEQHVTSAVLWHRAENAVFATVPGPSGQVHCRLIVEPIPRQNGWDWTVWRPGSDGRQSCYGRASSVISAMAAAEDAAGHWWKTGSPDD
ncbi:MAG: response regulator [Acetobacteraceae bacterium]|jgi:signal transduction histidine kinase